MCDRVAVMHEGSLVGEVEGDDVNSNRIMYFASGAFKLDDENGVAANVRASA
jgi:ABC-type dipeptide/oligopeptide/nickel transport system ATPase component